jgi:hypothetical protein
MSDATPRFLLPFLAAGQAQKEVYHNEALNRVDMLLQPVVQSIGSDTPPPNPIVGDCWVCGAAPTGLWAGQAHAIAGWTDGGWRFVAPRHGTFVWVANDALFAQWNGTNWIVGAVAANGVYVEGVQVLGRRQIAIPDPTGGTVVDASARTAISAILAALRQHGIVEA